MIRLISRTDGRIAITLLGIASLLLLAVFISPVMRVEASHCLPGSAKSCVEDVRNTKHNLNLNADINQTGTTEICVFCHTPHGFKKTGGIANPDGLAQVPLWNRATKASSGVYTPYSGIHFDAQGATPGVPKGVSLACLSCHDGTISFDALINAPGSGGFNSANLSDLTTAAASGIRNPTMTFGGFDVDGTGRMKSGNRADQTSGGGFLGGLNNFVGGTGAEGMQPFPNLTTDLSDDHPISMRMPGNAGEDPQFRDVFLNRVTDGADGSKISFVSRYGAGERVWSADKRDRIRLYPTNGAADLSTYVECASCHNPHTPRTLFLRLPTVSTLDYPAAGVTVNGVTGAALADFTGGGFGTQLVNETTPFTISVNSATGSANDLSHKPNQGSLVCLSCHQK